MGPTPIVRTLSVQQPPTLIDRPIPVPEPRRLGRYYHNPSGLAVPRHVRDEAKRFVRRPDRRFDTVIVEPVKVVADLSARTGLRVTFVRGPHTTRVVTVCSVDAEGDRLSNMAAHRLDTLAETPEDYDAR